MNIVDVSGVTRSRRVFTFATPKRIEDASVGKQAHLEMLVVQYGQSIGVNQKSDQDEVLNLIQRSEFNMVDELSHTPSKIFVLSLLMNSEADIEALQKVRSKHMWIMM